MRARRWRARRLRAEAGIPGGQVVALDIGKVASAGGDDELIHRGLVEEPKNLTVVRDALYEVTGRRLAIVTTVGDDPDDKDGGEEPAGEQNLIALLKTDLDATEVEETS